MSSMVEKNPQKISSMFDRIVPRYDLVNSLMSLGMDRRWRSLTARLAAGPGDRALDVGTGTGYMARELHRAGASPVFAVDFSARMLAAAAEKDADGEADIAWFHADAQHLPFPDESFDCVTNAFLLRNLSDLTAGLNEMARVLKPGGRLVCLDITQPPGGPFGAAYRLYFERLIPLVGGLISSDREAYRYLPSSLKGFPDAASLADLLAEVGLTDVRTRLLGGGSVALHQARKR